MADPFDALFLSPEEALVMEMKKWPQPKRDALKSMIDKREAVLSAQLADCNKTIQALGAELEKVETKCDIYRDAINRILALRP